MVLAVLTVDGMSLGGQHQEPVVSGYLRSFGTSVSPTKERIQWP